MSGVRPAHLPFTVTPARDGADCTTSRPFVASGRDGGVPFSRAAGGVSRAVSGAIGGGVDGDAPGVPGFVAAGGVTACSLHCCPLRAVCCAGAVPAADEVSGGKPREQPEHERHRDRQRRGTRTLRRFRGRLRHIRGRLRHVHVRRRHFVRGFERTPPVAVRFLFLLRFGVFLECVGEPFSLARVIGRFRDRGV